MTLETFKQLNVSAESHWKYGAMAFSGYIATLDILHRPYAYFVNNVLELPPSRRYDSPRVAYPALKEDLAVALGATVRHSVAIQAKDRNVADEDIEAVSIKVTEKGFEWATDVLANNAVISEIRPNPLADHRFFVNFYDLLLRYPQNYAAKTVLSYTAELQAGIPVDPQYTRPA